MAIIGLAAFLFFEYEMSSDIAGGFKEGTEEYKVNRTGFVGGFFI